MGFDFGVIIGLIGVISLAGVVGLSYVGAFMMGRSRGRREVEMELRGGPRGIGEYGASDRLLMIEGAVSSMAQAVERLTEAQRVALLEQLRTSQEPRPGKRLPGNNTPA